jgi:hypothetical protein
LRASSTADIPFRLISCAATVFMSALLSVLLSVPKVYHWAS